MLMPETAVDKDCLLSANERQVRFPRKVLAVEPIPIAEAMHQPAHKKLRLHSFAPDRPHICTAALWRERIHVPASSGARLASRAESLLHSSVDMKGTPGFRMKGSAGA